MYINRLIYYHLPISLRLRIFKCKMMDKPAGYGEVYRITLNKALDTFLTSEEKNDKILVKKLTDDIIRCWLKYQALPYEYFLFNFRNRSDAERMAFETDMDRLATLRRITGEDLFLREINNKYNFYLLAKPFFRREVIKINKDTCISDFITFCKNHKSVFVKPLESSQGRGAHIFSYTDEVEASDYLKGLTEDESSWMVEERIRQSAAMAHWNETSVNTIRIPSFLRKDKFTVIWTRMRMGKKGSIVDNAGAGGIVVNVDPQTGVFTSDGIDEAFNHFDCHPDSGLVFKGWQVPRWDELLKTVEELHSTVFNKHIYVAWDFALTDDGWVVIEGNWGQLLGQQTASQVGVREEFHKLIGD